jgi:sugar phosphate isomerase/epimerase
VEFLPLGRGSLDFADTLAAVNEVGYDSWLLAELDSYDGDPLEAARSARSISSKSSTSFPDPRAAGFIPAAVAVTRKK